MRSFAQRLQRPFPNTPLRARPPRPDVDESRDSQRRNYSRTVVMKAGRGPFLKKASGDGALNSSGAKRLGDIR